MYPRSYLGVSPRIVPSYSPAYTLGHPAPLIPLSRYLPFHERQGFALTLFHPHQTHSSISSSPPAQLRIHPAPPVLEFPVPTFPRVIWQPIVRTPSGIHTSVWPMSTFGVCRRRRRLYLDLRALIEDPLQCPSKTCIFVVRLQGLPGTFPNSTGASNSPDMTTEE